jgi:hypothetical protein
MPQRSPREALRAAAIGYANQGIPILPDLPPDQLGNHPPPDLAGGPPACCCRRRDCPALPLHLPRRFDHNTDAGQAAPVARWWTATPKAAIATVAGAAFDVIELHTALPAEAILTWLADQGLTPGPVLSAGLGRLQVLAAPDSYQADRYDCAAAAILYLPPGVLVLLPPSQQSDGQPVWWLRPLNPGIDLPDGRELFFALFDLPATPQLANPDLYTFPAPHPRSRQTATARP